MKVYFAVSIVLLAFCWTSQVYAERSEAAASLADLPLVEVNPREPPTRLAIFYSGDGGWAKLVNSVSVELADAGVRVVGVNSLRYFWSARRQEEATGDLARILRTYVPENATPDAVMLIGYSRGADVLPFLVNDLPEELRRRVGSLVLIAPGHDTTFEVHVVDWLSRGSPGLPVIPQIERLDARVLCLYGDEDDDTVCPELPRDRIMSIRIGKGHHLGGAYEEIAKQILAFEDSSELAPQP